MSAREAASRTRAVCLLSALLAGCANANDPKPAPVARASSETVAAARPLGDEVNPRLLRRFKPLPAQFDAGASPLTVEKVELGRALFFDPRLSKSGTVSCATCHDPRAYGTDGNKLSPGHGGKVGRRNTPTVLNAAGAFAQFWDGRAATLEEQAIGPLLNVDEMGMTAAEITRTLQRNAGYESAFRAAFPGEAEPITLDNVAAAIGAFERKLVTPSRWDAYLLGNASALTPAEKTGLKTFLNVGCMVCHTGVLLGGSMFERAGAVEPWPNQTDRGREQVTGLAGDRLMFKVPTLRNVERTAPYFHDGSMPTLDGAVRAMGKHQLGLDLTDEETASIVTWLKTLTGAIPAELTAPELVR